MIRTKQGRFNQACINGDIEIVKSLIDDCDIDPSINGNLPIEFAGLNNNREIVELLLTDKRVMDNIDYALKWSKGWSCGYDLIKDCLAKMDTETAPEPKSETESDGAGTGITLARIELVNGKLTLEGEGDIEPQALLTQMGFV